MFKANKPNIVTRSILLAKDFKEACARYTANPKLRNDSNCYTYALGIPEHGHACPGSLHRGQGNKETMDKADITAKNIFNRLVKDGLRPIESTELKKQGALNVIAACVSDKDDYHFYRMHRNNTWSHQKGYGGPISEFDNGDDMIFDPSIADRGRYKEFLGYFVLPEEGLTYAVKPKALLDNLFGD